MVITESSSSVALVGTGVLGAVGFLGHDSTARVHALEIAASLAGASIVTQILKYSINRPRPFSTYPELDKQAPAGGPSMCSGHTSNAFAFATSLSLSYPKWYVIAPSYAWASAVGYSRMHLGVHYPSDVLVGAFVGSGVAYLSHRVAKQLARRHGKRMPARLGKH